MARYRVPPPPRARRVTGLKLKKGRLSWKAQRDVKSYEVVVTRPDKTTTTHSTKAARLRLRGLPRKGRIKVSILAVDQLDRPGPVARATLNLAARRR